MPPTRPRPLPPLPASGGCITPSSHGFLPALRASHLSACLPQRRVSVDVGPAFNPDDLTSGSSVSPAENLSPNAVMSALGCGPVFCTNTDRPTQDRDQRVEFPAHPPQQVSGPNFSPSEQEVIWQYVLTCII